MRDENETKQNDSPQCNNCNWRIRSARTTPPQGHNRSPATRMVTLPKDQTLDQISAKIKKLF